MGNRICFFGDNNDGPQPERGPARPNKTSPPPNGGWGRFGHIPPIPSSMLLTSPQSLATPDNVADRHRSTRLHRRGSFDLPRTTNRIQAHQSVDSAHRCQSGVERVF
jgi:hypothetical protein